jgi:hypothetical protein
MDQIFGSRPNVITVKPFDEDYSPKIDPKWAETLGKIKQDKSAYCDEKAVEKLTELELKRIIAKEIIQIQKASGLFKAIAVQLRATDA